MATFLFAVALLNLLAYRHARAMLFFADDGVRTAPPEQLSAPRRAWTLLRGVRIPRPESARRPEYVDLNCVDFSIPVPGEDVTLGAWYCGHRGDGGSPLVLLFHGYAEEKSSLLEEAAALHGNHFASVLLVDFRGSGGSSEAYTTVGVDEARDVVAAVDFARSELAKEGDPLILFGRSMGAAAILRAVSEHDVRADSYVLESVFDDLLSTVRNRFGAMGLPSFPAAELLVFWGGRQAGFDGFAHRPVAYAARVDAPLLLLHGAEDPRATVEQARAVAEAADGVADSSETRGPGSETSLHVFPGAGHEPLLSVDPDAWHAAVSDLLSRAGTSTDPPPPHPEPSSLCFTEDGVVRSAPTSNTVRLTAAQAERIALTAFPPRSKPSVEETRVVPLGTVLARWLEDDAWPMATQLPSSLRDVTGPMYSYKPMEGLPDDPSMHVPQYLVRGTVSDPLYFPMNDEYNDDPESRVTFYVLVDSHDGEVRAMQCGDEMATFGPGGRTSLDHVSVHAPFVQLPPLATPMPHRVPTATPSVQSARRLLERYRPLTLADAGPQLRRTLALFPLWPGTGWTYRTAGSVTGCTAWQSWEESVEVFTVADARLVTADLALIRLGHKTTAVKHGERIGPAIESRQAAGSSHEPKFILIWRDEIYQPWNEQQLREQLAFLERPAIPTAAPRREYGTHPDEHPFPILRLPLTSSMPPVPSEGGSDWSRPRPEPPWQGDPQLRPCATISTNYGSTVVWQTFCEGVGWSFEASFGTNSGRVRWWRELEHVHYGKPR